jgi:hypothetical protein
LNPTLMEASLYIIVIVLALFLFAGFDETIRLFQYIDLELRYGVVKIRSYFLRKKLERQLKVLKKQMEKDYGEFLRDRTNDEDL